MFYRFNCGTFIEANSFKDAQTKFIEEITNEKEDPKMWHKCTCLGLQHRIDCPQNPINQGEIPF